MSHKVFVYGSLKKGFGLSSVLRSATGGEEATTVEQFSMVSLGAFPAVVKSDVALTHISGEVYEVDDNTLRVLDEIEGNPDFYCREEVETSLGKAWMYILSEDDTEMELANNPVIVKHGVWR